MKLSKEQSEDLFKIAVIIFLGVICMMSFLIYFK